jgi:hypothetical protein
MSVSSTGSFSYRSFGSRSQARTRPASIDLLSPSSQLSPIQKRHVNLDHLRISERSYRDAARSNDTTATRGIQPRARASARNSKKRTETPKIPWRVTRLPKPRGGSPRTSGRQSRAVLKRRVTKTETDSRSTTCEQDQVAPPATWGRRPAGGKRLDSRHRCERWFQDCSPCG